MKKGLSIILVIVMVMTLFAACGSKEAEKIINEGTEEKTSAASGNTSEEETTKEDLTENSNTNGSSNNTENDSDVVLNETFDTIEILESAVEKDTSETISKLQVEWETLKSEITTYEKYKENVDKIETFYDKINEETEAFCNRLYEYTLNYAELIMATNESTDEKYDAFDNLQDCIYDDASDDIRDEIYDGILDDMKDELYETVLEDAKETVSYSEWSDARSNEYDWWSEARSDVYGKWSDTRSDIYGFWSDMRGELWDDDIEGANEELEKFKNRVPKTDNEDRFILDERFDSIESLETAVEKDTDDTIYKLEIEWEELKATITTYEAYKENVEKIEAFYNKVNTETEAICNRLYAYTLNYAELIMNKNESTDEKYDAFDDIYDCIYNGAGEDIYDEIYAGILENMYDELYAGIIEDAYDTVSYSEWSEISSNEYDLWSDASSDVYDNWSATTSDIYDFWSDMRGELWDDDIEGASKVIEKFKNGN